VALRLLEQSLASVITYPERMRAQRLLELLSDENN
jgi:hypothetical protein